MSSIVSREGVVTGGGSADIGGVTTKSESAAAREKAATLPTLVAGFIL